MPKDKKRKRTDDQYIEPDTSKPTAIFTPTGPRKSTLSVAIPSSIIANAKSHDQKTYLAGTIARALAVFCVDEVVIFNDQPHQEDTTINSNNKHNNDTSYPGAKASDTEGYTALSDPGHFLTHILTYLETPPHLRKSLFPMHPNLRTAGTLPSLDMPHHLRANEYCPYREGVTAHSSKAGTTIDIGLSEPYLLRDVQIPSKMRVTVRLDETQDASMSNTNGNTSQRTATPVSPTTPREEAGYYWGYTPRQADSLSAVFTDAPFDGGYDFSIGTSERGQPLSDLLHVSSHPLSSLPSEAPAPSGLSLQEISASDHLLLIFGGPSGLETAASNDPILSAKGVAGSKVKELFDMYINILPGQGSRTIRTEEAVWLGLMGIVGSGGLRRGAQ